MFRSRPAARSHPAVHALSRQPLAQKLFKLSFISALLATLSACGGGGSAGAGAPPASTPTNPAPSMPAPGNPPATDPEPAPPDTQPAPNTAALASRPDNPDCVAPARTSIAASLSLVDAFPNLPRLNLPMKLIQAADDDSRWYAVLRNGGLDRFLNSVNTASVERYLDLTVSAFGEGGFLSAALHPDWPNTRELYVSYTINQGGLKSRLSRLVITDDNTLPASYDEQILVTVDQPYANHNGGDLAFGPDGLLYYGLGDGGNGGDPHDYGQNTRRLLGSILRLDVLGVAYPSPGYRVPADNPFAGNSQCGPGANGDDCPEIYAWGFRNPWRISFDTLTGDLWTGDVGQSNREEIDIVTLAGNYGWRCREGSAAFNSSGCSSEGFVAPIYDYGRAAGDLSVTGGFVYRASDIASLQGKYIFADYESGRVWSLVNTGSGYQRTELMDTNFAIAGLSQDNSGRVYVLDIGGGRIYGFSSTGSRLVDNVPNDLAATGCFLAEDLRVPAAGLIPYAPAAPFWSDHADKTRWLALPNGTRIDPTAAHWQFPPGTVLAKLFERNAQAIETRLFMRHPDGGWAGYTYQWNDAQNAATRLRNGAERTLGAQTWIYPSESECLSCHTDATEFVLGLSTAQQNSPFRYPDSGVTDNQLEVFNQIALFSTALPEPVDTLARLVDPMDDTATLADRARAYLHTNCAQCHRGDPLSGTDLDLRFEQPLAATRTCDLPPQAGDLDIADARLIAPADPGRSVLLARVARRDGDAMPPLASNEIDVAGVELLSDWINSLTSCP